MRSFDFATELWGRCIGPLPGFFLRCDIWCITFACPLVMITVYVVVEISCIDELSFGPVLVLDGL